VATLAEEGLARVDPICYLTVSLAGQPEMIVQVAEFPFWEEARRLSGQPWGNGPLFEPSAVLPALAKARRLAVPRGFQRSQRTLSGSAVLDD